MNKIIINVDEIENYFIECGSKIEEAVYGQMFGKKCFKLHKKAFICLFENCMVFKLNGVSHKKALSFKNTKLFDPSNKGRPMKEWAQVPYEHKATWSNMTKIAAKYLSS